MNDLTKGITIAVLTFAIIILGANAYNQKERNEIFDVEIHALNEHCQELDKTTGSQSRFVTNYIKDNWTMVYTPTPKAEKYEVEIVASFKTNGKWRTVLKYPDGTRTAWDDYKLGDEGDKMTVWKRGNTEWLKDPN